MSNVRTINSEIELSPGVSAQIPLDSNVRVSSETSQLIASEIKQEAIKQPILNSDLEASLSSLLLALISDKDEATANALNKLKNSSPSVEAFIQNLEERLEEAKLSLPQMLLLKTQLLSNAITQAQYESSSRHVALTLDQARAAILNTFPNDLDMLVTALLDDASGEQINSLVSVTSEIQTGQQDIQESTAINAYSDEVNAIISSLTGDASDDGIIELSEIQESIAGLIGSLISSSSISDTVINQLITSSSGAQAFINSIQSSIALARAALPQVIELGEQLENGSITQEQYISDVREINLTGEQTSAIISQYLFNNSQVFNSLLFSLLQEVSSIALPRLTSRITPVLGRARDSHTSISDLAPVSADRLKILAFNKDVQEILDRMPPPPPTPRPTDMSDAQYDLIVSTYERWLEDISTKSREILGNARDSRTSTSGVVLGNARGSHTSTSSVVLEPPGNFDIPSGFYLRNPIEPPRSSAALISNANIRVADFFQDIANQIAAAFRASAAQFNSLQNFMRRRPSIMSGARSIIKINGKASAYCTNASYTINYGWSEIKGIDEMIPNDLAPTSFSVTGSMTIFRIPNGSPITNYIGSDMFRGVIWPYTTIEIRDRHTDELIMLISRAAITSRSETFSARGLVSTTLNFVGMDFRDEEMPKFLPNNLTEPSGMGGGFLGAIRGAVGRLF